LTREDEKENFGEVFYSLFYIIFNSLKNFFWRIFVENPKGRRYFRLRRKDPKEKKKIFPLENLAGPEGDP